MDQVCIFINIHKPNNIDSTRVNPFSKFKKKKGNGGVFFFSVDGWSDSFLDGTVLIINLGRVLAIRLTDVVAVTFSLTHLIK